MNDSTPSSGYATTDWAEQTAQRWATYADRLEAQLEPVSDALFAATPIASGQRVLDIGCGRGATTRRAAALAGPTGSAVGIDVAENLVAEARVLAEGIDNIGWILADAQSHTFGTDRFDVLISRFGVMFFDDAITAFTNLRSAAAPDASMSLAVWQARDHSELFEVPLAIGRELARDAGLEIEADVVPPDGGPFSFGDPQFVEHTLSTAGWSNISTVPQTLALYNGGPGTVAGAVEVSLAIGPLRATLEAATDAQREHVRAGLVERLTPYHDGTGVRFTGAINLIQATLEEV